MSSIRTLAKGLGSFEEGLGGISRKGGTIFIKCQHFALCEGCMEVVTYNVGQTFDQANGTGSALLVFERSL